MALIQESIPGLYNGVSQQPPALRLKNQGEEQVNAHGDLVHGLVKRPGSEFLFELPAEVIDWFHTHVIERDLNEQYLVFFTNDSDTPLIVYDTIENTTREVNYGHLDEDLEFEKDEDVKDYLTTGSAVMPTNRFRTTTVGDYTFVVNREVQPEMSEDKTDPEPKKTGWIHYTFYSGLEQGRLQINGQEETFELEVNDGLDEVVGQIHDTINNEFSGISSTRYGNVLKIEADEEIEQLQFNDPDCLTFTYAVDRYDDLFPAIVLEEGENPKFRVLQSEYGDNINYYVQREGDRWEETVGFDLKYRFDESTLPHRLVRMPDQSFVFAPVKWFERQVGDEKSAPVPTFTRQKVENVFFHQNRLGFVTETNIIMSQTAEYFDFWPETALEVSAVDPVDIGVATTEVSFLREVIPFNKNLLLRADNNQFILSHGAEGLTPENVAIDRSTRYETIPLSRSVSIGSDLYFCTPQQDYVAIREYFVQPDSLVEDAADVTMQVRSYIPKGDTVILEAMPSANMVFVQTSGDPYNLYVYTYYWEADQKVQSAWERWEFKNEIKGIGKFGPDLMVLLQVNDKVIAVRLHLAVSPRDEIYLDKKQELEGEYDSDESQTVFKLGYSEPGTDFTLVDPDTRIAPGGVEKDEDSDEVRIWGDWTDKEYIIGERFTKRYEFTRWMLKDDNNRVHPGRLQLKSIKLYFQDTGYFRLNITPRGRPTIKREFTGFILGESSLNTGNLHDGNRRFMALGKADETRIEVINDSHLPSNIQSAAFEGFHHARAQSLG